MTMGIVAVRHVMLDTEEDKKKTPMRLGTYGDVGETFPKDPWCWNIYPLVIEHSY